MKLRNLKKIQKKKYENLIEQFRIVLDMFYLTLQIKEKSDFKHGYDFMELTIKEVPNWYFCIDFNKSKSIYLASNIDVIYGDHINIIDKFKPSRCPVSCFDVNEFICELFHIKNLPKRAIVNSLSNYPPSIDEFDKEFIEKEYSEFTTYHNNKQNTMYDKFIYAKDICESMLYLPYVKGVGLSDFNGLFRTGYRYNYDLELYILIDKKYQDGSKDFFEFVYNQIEEGYVDKVNRYRRKETGRLYLNSPTLISTFKELNKCQYKFLK